MHRQTNSPSIDRWGNIRAVSAPLLLLRWLWWAWVLDLLEGVGRRVADLLILVLQRFLQGREGVYGIPAEPRQGVASRLADVLILVLQRGGERRDRLLGFRGVFPQDGRGGA